jgi:hypothetical protein
MRTVPWPILRGWGRRGDLRRPSTSVAVATPLVVYALVRFAFPTVIDGLFVNGGVERGWFSTPLVDGIRFCGPRHLAKVLTKGDRTLASEAASHPGLYSWCAEAAARRGQARGHPQEATSSP